MSDTGVLDQRRLHAWPAWDESVRAARLHLGFDPDWTPRPGEEQSPEYREWRASVELRRLLAEARRWLITMHLSERFTDYWLACFLAPYERDGLEVIFDPQPSGEVRQVRVFPPPTSLWFEAGIDHSMAPAMLVIEGPAALASSTVLRAAERRALDARRRSGFPRQHPLARSRQIGPAQEERAIARAREHDARAKAMTSARAWRAAGEKPWFIARRLSERGYPVSERTVRRWLSDRPPPTETDTPSGQNEVPERET